MRQTTSIGRMITFCLLILFTFSFHVTFAQAPIRCYTDEMDSFLHANNPNLPSKEEFEEWMQSEIDNNASFHIIGGVYYIPVVVHVIHDGEAVGTGTNVSFAAIQSQIDVLNEDFRKMLGTNGWNTNPVGADTKIEFCLAQRRPDGSAFPTGEPGVNRINRTTAAFIAPPYSTPYIDATIKPWTYNNGNPTATRGWLPSKYMNIWLCNISGGILGYAQFPQSPLGGMGCNTTAAATDGVVFLYSSIGKSAVTGFPGPYNEGRTATHEIGHWLGLRHIWGDGGCTVDDFCNDTPEAAAANYTCPAGTNSCTAAPDAGPDMIENYMDYTDDLCMNIFTNDQKTRMRTVLESSPLRSTLINSDACTPPNANDASIVDVVNPKGDNCAGTLTPTVTLRNRGSSNLTTATISYKIDNGNATTFSWSGSIVPGATANVVLPAFTTTLGTHNFKAYSTLPNGAIDPSTMYDTSSIDFVISNGETAPFTETFESTVFPPDVRWVIENTNSDCYQWVGASATSINGTFNNNTAQFPGFGNTSASTDNLITPIFILPCNATAATIQFDVAYRRRNATVANYDRLYIEISENCGTTWNAIPIYDKTGTALQVLTTTLATYYTPVGTTDWRTETVNLLPFVTGSSKNVKFRIRGVAANGNNIYIDNFKFNATTPGEIELTQGTADVLDGGYYNYGSVLAGAPTTATFTITNTGTSNLTLTAPITVTGANFTLGSSFGTTTVAAGATTTFSVIFNSAAAGTFTGNVSFVTNDCDEGTYNFQLNATAIATPPVANFSGTPLTICAGSTVTFTDLSSNATSWSWNFGAGATPATSTAQNPTVTFNTVGTNTITLTASNAFGSDLETKTNYITILSATGAALPIIQGFTTATFVPTNWSLVNANASSTTWVRSATIGNVPTAGNSMMFDNFNYSDADDDEVRMEGANFTGLSSAQLTFDVAYAAYNTTSFDGLQILVSTDCGVTFTSVYNKTGATVAVGNLPTAAATTAAFTPTAAQWRTETINLTPYIGNPKVIVAFRNLANYGNRLFVDNINLTGVVAATPPSASFTGTPTTLCTSQTVTFTNTSTGAPTSYAWTFTGGTPATSTAANPTVTYAASGTYTVALTATNANGSNTSTQTNYITVNAAPATPGTITGSTTACNGSTGNVYSIVAVAGATSYTWTVPAGATITAGQGTTSATITFGSTSGNISVTATNACGTSTASLKAVTLSAAPVTPGTITGSATACNGSTGNVYSIAVVSGATSYTWTVPAGATITSGQGTTSATITFGSTSGNVSVTATNACGTSTASLKAVTLSAAPVTPGTITGSATACNGSTGNVYSIAAVSGATSYTWTVPAGATITSGQGTTSATITFGSTSGNVSVTATNACGTSTASLKAVTLSAAPVTPGTITGSATACNGSTGNVYSIAAVSGATSYTWTVPAGATITAGQGTTSATITFGSTSGNVTVTATNACGTSTASLKAVTLSAAPVTPGTITGSATACNASTGNVYSIAAVSGATSYTWTVPAGATITAGQGTTSATITFGSTSGNVTVNATNACGTSTASLKAVTLSGAPVTPGTITGSATACNGSTGNVYSIVAVSGATTYTWTVPAGATITAGQGTTSATITFGSTSGNISVTATNACGTSTTSVKPVTINNSGPATPGAIAGTTTACSGSLGNVYSIAAVSGATSYTWTVPAGATITAGQGTTSATITFGSTSGNISVTASSACGTSAPYAQAISVNSAPVAPGPITGSFVTCPGTLVAYNVAAVSGASGYTWTVPSGSVILSGQGTNAILVQMGTISGVVSVTASNSCGTSSASNGSITISSAAPLTPGTISGSTTVCSGTTGNVYSIAAVAGATSYLWTIPSGAIITAGQGTTSITVSFGSTSGSVSVSATNSCGTSTVSAQPINVNSIPATPGVISGTTTVCPNSTGNTYSIAPVSGATSYTWTVPSGATIVSGQSTANCAVNFGLTTGNVAVTASNTCGTSALNNVAVTVLPSATVPGSITGPISVCENVSGIVYTVPVVTGAISYNWTVPVGGTIVSGQGTNSAVIDFGTTTGAVQVTQTDACGTSLPSILSVIVNAIPSLPAVSVVDSCGTSDLTAIGTSLLWSTTETTPVITVTTAGIYTVTQTVNGCTSLAASISAAPFNAPSVTFASLNDVCINAPIVTLTGGIPAGGTYSGIAVTAGQFDPFTAGFGTFAINYNYTDENGCSGNATQNISVGCAGLDETSGNLLSIYPNPTSGQFTISSSLELISEINVYDQTGRLIQVISKNENQVNVDLSLCAEGVYSLEIETATGKFRERIILNK
jgi:PKD repeat protein